MLTRPRLAAAGAFMTEGFALRFAMAFEAVLFKTAGFKRLVLIVAIPAPGEVISTGAAVTVVLAWPVLTIGAAGEVVSAGVAITVAVFILRPGFTFRTAGAMPLFRVTAMVFVLRATLTIRAAGKIIFP